MSKNTEPVERQPVRVLLIEDNAGDARLIKEFLDEATGAEVALVQESRLTAGLGRLSKEEFDVVLLDLALPDSAGMDTVGRARLDFPQVPLVVLTGREDEEMGLRAVKLGAEDYLVKGKVSGDSLWRAIRYAIERHRLREELRVVSLVDELTGLYNRRGFLTMAAQQLKLARRHGRPPLLLFADVDELKQVNDGWGHAEGDRALRRVADSLRATFRRSDIIARTGGDEFAVLAWEPNPAGAAALERRLQEHLADANREHGGPFALSLSTGTIPCTAESADTIGESLALADAAMYKRKRGRRRGLEGS